ncbi:Protein involved in positive regulation of both 1, 3-beta-glucan synthesis and the Pkc1p-MAPK pathway [Trichuris trichiura]|uniref:Protein involved in positive regulation of both 1, 3-beta-glucan synthesis and the Pkc1p-MAPK pathway n=1 Tax=Trichuris trichiura TaxID=36087 RepID=A0A077ZK58_TRITR|nr:Protein involved in positive regulation of both 1, 3-beta-glucan synthesis and the Pkc1p-MAPK pathway [Trichuris trichiura]
MPYNLRPRPKKMPYNLRPRPKKMPYNLRSRSKLPQTEDILAEADVRASRSALAGQAASRNAKQNSAKRSKRNVANESDQLGTSAVQSSSTGVSSDSSYEVTMRSWTSSSEEEEEQPTCSYKTKEKKIPSWANDDKLEALHAYQLKSNNPNLIFAGACPPLKAKEVFGRRREIKRHSESAVWETDKSQ